MPTYEYACKSCGEHLEVVQSFRDDSLTTCPACGGDLRKVFGSVGIVFKGSGFYKTDNRSGSGPSGDTKASESAATVKGSGTADSAGAKSDGAAAPKTETPTSTTGGTSGEGTSKKKPATGKVAAAS